MSAPQRAGGFDFVNRVYLDIGVPIGYTNSEAHGISETGTVCGYVSGPGLRAFVWEDRQMTLLTLPVGPNAVADDISNSDSVCGWMGLSPFLGAHAFIWNSGNTIDLGTIFPSSIGAVATGINELNGVCGNSNFDDLIYVYVRRGFFWSDGTAQDLGMLPGLINCEPTAINDDNLIVGKCSNQNGVGRAFIWQDGLIHALNDLVPAQLNLHVDVAYDINNQGQIAATGFLPNGDTVALRLTPIPPLLGDITCDWLINSEDLMAVIRNWGECPPEFTAPCTADLNDDHRVNVPDVLAVINHWGQGQGMP